MKNHKGAMTERERIETLLDRRTPDRVPIWPFMPNGFAVRYNNLSIADAYTNPPGLYESLRKTARDFGWVFVPRGYALMQGCEVPVDTPPENLHAMKKAADDHGWYR